MAKAITMTRSVSMPISLAVSGSWLVACIARPDRVRATNQPRMSMQMGAAMIRKRSLRCTVTEPSSNGSPGIFGKTRAFLASG